MGQKWRKLYTKIYLLLRIKLFEGIIFRNQLQAFYKTIFGPTFFHVLLAALDLDLFTLLSKQRKKTAQEIARHLKLEDQPVRILLLNLTAMGLLHKKGRYYVSSYIASRMLSSGSPENLIAYIRLQQMAINPALQYFGEAIKRNTNAGLKLFKGKEATFYERLTHHPEIEQVFQDAMHNISVQTNHDLTQYADFSQTRHLLDVGGGDGTNVMDLVQKYPHMTATIFDSESVCQIASANIKKHGLEARVKVCPGQCFKDEYPKGIDHILYAHFFTIWSKDKDLQLLEKSFKALPANGRVTLFNMAQSDSGKGPLTAAGGSAYFITLATGEGMLYTAKEYRELMLKAGFAKTSCLKLPLDHIALTGIKGSGT